MLARCDDGPLFISVIRDVRESDDTQRLSTTNQLSLELSYIINK